MDLSKNTLFRSFFAVLVLIALFTASASAQRDRIETGKAKVITKPDGSIAITTATGKIVTINNEPITGNIIGSFTNVSDLPPTTPGSPGRFARVTSGVKGLYVDSGTAWLLNTSPVLHAEWFGVKGDGTTDNDLLLDNVIDAIKGTGHILQLGAGTYGVVTKVGQGNDNNIHIRGLSPQQTTIKKLAGSTERFIFGNAGYSNWIVEDLTIDGNSGAGAGNGQSISLSFTNNITFRNVDFRNLTSFYVVGATKTLIENCRFWGARSGLMQAATDRPTPNASASYLSAISLGSGGIEDFVVKDSYFHFLDAGIAGSLVNQDKARGIKFINNYFRGDYWNQPLMVARYNATGFTSGGFLGGGFLQIPTGAHPTPRVNTSPSEYGMSMTVEVGAGASFFRDGGADEEIDLTPAPASLPRIGDSFELSDGRRAEITAVVDSNTIQVAKTRFEYVSTFEDAGYVPSGTSTVAWKINRYYGAFLHPSMDVPSPTSTQLRIYGEFTNVFDGEPFSATGLSYAGREIRVFAPAVYRGLHLAGSINGTYEDVLVQGNTFRGSWADQLSLFRVDAPRILGNKFYYGGDEGITLTGSHGATVMGNTFETQGASFIYVSSERASVTGNTGFIWSTVNPNVGGIDWASRDGTLSNNTISTGILNNKARWGILVTGTAADSIIEANTIRTVAYGGEQHDVKVVLEGTQDASNMIIRDVNSISRTGTGTFSSTGGLFTGGMRATDRNGSNGLSVTDVGTIQAQSRAATVADAAGTQPSSFEFVSQRWNGTQSAGEPFILQTTRNSNTANDLQFQFIGSDGAVALALSGGGGRAAIGHAFPSIPALGQFHVRSTAATTPTGVFRGAVSQTADLFRLENSDGLRLSYFGSDGRAYLKAPVTPPLGSAILANQCTLYLDQVSNGGTLTFVCKKSDGELVTFEIPNNLSGGGIP